MSAKSAKPFWEGFAKMFANTSAKVANILMFANVRQTVCESSVKMLSKMFVKFANV